MRLRDYDYAQAGAYFVTVCTSQRKCLLGDIVNDVMQCNAHGMMVQACWEELPRQYGHVTLDEFVVMPNHVHAVSGRHDLSIEEIVGHLKRAATRQGTWCWRS